MARFLKKRKPYPPPMPSLAAEIRLLRMRGQSPGYDEVLVVYKNRKMYSRFLGGYVNNDYICKLISENKKVIAYEYTFKGADITQEVLSSAVIDSNRTNEDFQQYVLKFKRTK